MVLLNMIVVMDVFTLNIMSGIPSLETVFIGIPAHVGQRMAHTNADKHITVLRYRSPALPIVVVSS
jgi:hypothetical protein